MNAEHSFMLLVTFLNYQEDLDVNVYIAGKIYNSSCTPILFVEKDFDSWDPKIHGSRQYLQGFYVAALIDECRTNKHYPLAMFQNGIKTNTIATYIGNMEDGIPLSFSDYLMTSKEKKNCFAMFKIQMKCFFSLPLY